MKEVSIGRKEKSVVIVGVILVLLVVLGINAVKSVPVNSVGVRYSDLRGTISETPLYSGLHFKVPFVDKITSVSTELRTADVDGVQVTTQDAQRATIDIELQYSILPDDAVETFRKFRSTQKKIGLKPFFISAFKGEYKRLQQNIQLTSLWVKKEVPFKQT